MGEATVNGDMPHSAFLDHIQKYPIVSDSIATFTSNPYGKKSIDLTNAGYTKFVKPTFPYFEKPAAYAKPYVAKADELGDSLLSQVDQRIPIVKSETKEIRTTVFDYAHWPLKKIGESKQYVFSTYNKEYEKCGGDGVVAGGKALVSSGFVISSEWLAYIGSLLQAKSGEAKQVINEKTGQAKDKADQLTGQAKEKAGQVKDQAHHHAKEHQHHHGH